jgi:hypothetical protein
LAMIPSPEYLATRKSKRTLTLAHVAR